MSVKPLLASRKKVQVLSAFLFFIALGVLIATDAWWPGIMLAIGLPLALRQYLLGRKYDTSITLLVFIGTYITVQFDISWRIFLPILFTLGALYILFREFLAPEESIETEKEEEINEEIEQNKK